MKPNPSTYQLIALDKLQRGHYQPRKQFDENALNELAQSIKTQGLIEPLVVRPIDSEHYEIIAGERRWRACQQIGLSTIPCLIGHYNDEQAAAITLIENIQRENLNLIEEATGYQRLLVEFHYLQEEIALLVGKSRSHIANILRLLTLSDAVQSQLRDRRLSLGHARMLVGLTTGLQQHFLNLIEQKGWSVRQLEQAIKQYKLAPAMPDERENDIVHLENGLSDQLGAPVKIDTKAGEGGWLKVKFFDNETLEGLLERLGLRYD